jgi:signal transduction histidine kinase
MKQSRDATRMRDEVLRVVAHDLRSPLNTISLSAGLLGQQGLPAGQEAGKDRLAVIERSVAQADRLIQDLLDVARVEAGELQIEAEPVDVSGVIAETIELHQPLAAQRKIQLRVERVPEGLVMQADRRRVLQVFANLLGNAFKFSAEGGMVTLRVSKQDGAACFSVQDQGQGITKSDLARLFEPFWQGNKRKDQGAGLGLSISKAIVQAHGGKIWVESQPGAGSTFYFTLPLAAAQTGSESMAAD